MVDRIERAWASDVQRQRWDDPARVQGSLTVAVLSATAFAQFTGDSSGSVAGVTTGPGLFVVPTRVTQTQDREDDDTFAHELAHVQDFRVAGEAMASIPTYLEEGKASVLGDVYAREPRRLASSARTMAAFTGDEVQLLLQRFRTSAAERNAPGFVYAGEVMGALFVEYLAVHVRRDALARLCDAIESAGQGRSFSSAFRAEMGTSLSVLEARFVDFIRATEGQPSARLRGTLYAP